MTANAARAFLLLVTLTACEGGATKADLTQSAPSTASDAVADRAAVELTPSRAGLGGVAGQAVSESKIAAPLPAASAAPASEAQSPSSGAVITQEVQPGSMLVRVGTASLQVDSLDVGIARVRDVARRTGAVVANTQLEGGHEQTRSASLQLRIPSEHFDDAVNGLTSVGKLESVNVNVEDVGEEYVDVQARVANARRLEQRLVDLLATRTGKLADVLSVERELARVREEIERYEGRMRYLRSRASVSTLTVSVHEPYPIVADRPGARPIRDAFVQAWRNLVGFTAGFIELLGILVPLGIIALALVVAARRVIPNIMPRLTAAKPTPGGNA
jgi:uncharacterized protein DUF4349